MKLVKKLKIRNCKLNNRMKTHSCFLYDFNKLGITYPQLEEAFEGCELRVYRNDSKKERLSDRLQKCLYCGEKFDNLAKHLKTVHNIPTLNVATARFQLDLYREMLRLVRKDVNIWYFVFTSVTCQLCDGKKKDNREGICLLPESTRNKVRSLNVLGFTCDGFDDKWVKHYNRYGFILVRR